MGTAEMLSGNRRAGGARTGPWGRGSKPGGGGSVLYLVAILNKCRLFGKIQHRGVNWPHELRVHRALLYKNALKEEKVLIIRRSLNTQSTFGA